MKEAGDDSDITIRNSGGFFAGWGLEERQKQKGKQHF